MKSKIFLLFFLGIFFFSFASANLGDCTSNSYTYGRSTASVKSCYKYNFQVYPVIGDSITFTCQGQKQYINAGVCDKTGCSGIVVLRYLVNEEEIYEEVKVWSSEDVKLSQANTRQDEALCSIKFFSWCLIK